MTNSTSDVIEVSKNNSRLALQKDGKSLLSFDSTEKKVYANVANIFTSESEEVVLASYSDISSFYYVEGEGELYGMLRLRLKGVGFKTNSNKVFHGFDCDYDSYKELIPLIREYVGNIPVVEDKIESTELKMGSADVVGMLVLFLFAGVVGFVLLAMRFIF
jgi:hypothetical protein